MRTFIGVLATIASIAILIWIEQVLEVAYILKTMAKAILFLLIPFLLFRKNGFPFFRLRQTDRKSMNIAIVSGIAIMGMIVATFIILKPFIDIDALLDDLADAGVTSIVFPFVGFYILFGNSLLEEFFFRGLLPSFLDRPLLRLLLPSFFFAIYHIAIFLPWFSTPILLLAVVGLWIGGIIFQLVNERSGTILPSWIIHMFADVGVLIVGVYMIYFY